MTHHWYNIYLWNEMKASGLAGGWWIVGEGMCVRWFSRNLSGTSGHSKPYDMAVFHASLSLILNADRLKYRELTIYIHYTLMKTTSTAAGHSTTPAPSQTTVAGWCSYKERRKGEEATLYCGMVVRGRREEHGCKWRLVRFEIYTLPSSTYKHIYVLARTLHVYALRLLRCVGFEWTTNLI